MIEGSKIPSLARQRQAKLLDVIIQEELPPGGTLPNLKFIRDRVNNLKLEVAPIHRTKVKHIELLVDELITKIKLHKPVNDSIY